MFLQLRGWLIIELDDVDRELAYYKTIKEPQTFEEKISAIKMYVGEESRSVLLHLRDLSGIIPKLIFFIAGDHVCNFVDEMPTIFSAPFTTTFPENNLNLKLEEEKVWKLHYKIGN